MADVALSVRGITLGLLAIVAVLVAASVAEQAFRLATGADYPFPIFKLAAERNVPTWFQSSLLLACAVIALAISLIDRAGEGAWAGHWGGMALVLSWMSLDEAAALHERLNEPLSALLGTSGFLWYAWVIPAMLAVLIVAVSYWKFTFRLPPQTRNSLVLAAAVFVAGAVGMEMLEAFVGSWTGAGMGPDSTRLEGGQRILFVSLELIEETMEMAAVVVVAHALMTHIRTQVGRVTISVRP